MPAGVFVEDVKAQLQKEQDRQDQRRALELNLVIGHVESVIR